MDSANNSKARQFVDGVLRFSTAHGLFRNNGKYVIGLSGGADSVALLHVMNVFSQTQGIIVEAVHCNFHLRGEESLRDENFCKSLCDRLCIPIHLVHFDTKEYAAVHHVSIEMAARDLRYAYFESLRTDIGADYVCVAHHRDDSVETVILNLVRGTGIRGLRGIQPVSGHVARPLLAVSREDIIAYLESIGQDYVTDSTNLVNDVKRNKIRLDVIPLLKQLNPSVQRSIFETSLHVNGALNVYDKTIDDNIRELIGTDDIDIPTIFSVDRLMEFVSPESILFTILGRRGYKSSQILQVFGAVNRKSGYFASKSHELVFDRGNIIVQPINYKVSNKIMHIPEEGRYVYAEECVFTFKASDAEKGFDVSHDKKRACLDAERIHFPLCIRPIKAKDRFMPFGMKNYKLLSDYLTDRKFSLFDKRRQLVVTDATDAIVWLVGERTDNRWRVVANTTKVLVIDVQ